MIKENIKLTVHGQGVFLFKSVNKESCFFIIHDKLHENNITVQFVKKNVIVSLNDNLLNDKNNDKGLVDKQNVYYWFSLDSQNEQLYAGIGEPRLETVIYKYKFNKFKKLLESFCFIEHNETIEPIRFIKDPVTSNIPLLIKNNLSMNHIAKGVYLHKSHLSNVSQVLYDSISGKKFILDSKDFPDFSKAIERSINTPGLWCNKRLIEKSNEFGKSDILETYLRITLTQNNGESPGIPYVMEIWPSNHYSPIHNHAGANAIIRVLYGKINVSLYPYLNSSEQPFKTVKLEKDEITWISPSLNQTHQLKNTSKKTCITIQSYTYDDQNNYHYDYFDYIDSDGNKKQYEPDSDMDFVDFKKLMKEEWKTRTTCNIIHSILF